VLVLLPTSSSKLLACWKGPYPVTDKVSPVDYKMKVRGGIEKVFHVNMLTLWHDRAEDEDKIEILSCLDVIAGLSSEQGELEELNAEMIPVVDGKETVKDVDLSTELSEQEAVELQDLLSEYPDIFSDVPKITDVIQHTVRTVTYDPVHEKP